MFIFIFTDTKRLFVSIATLFIRVVINNIPRAQYACPRAGIMASMDFSEFFFQKLFPDSPGLHKTHFKAHIIRKIVMVLDLLQHYWFYST